MIKMILVGIWVVVILSGSTWYFGQSASSAGANGKDPSPYFGGLDYVKLETIVVPAVRDDRVVGYIILDSVYTIKQSKKSSMSVPIEYILQDIIIGSIYGNKDIDFLRLEKLQLADLQKEILVDINKKLGEKIVYDVLIQKIDFMSKEDVRDLQLRRS